MEDVTREKFLEILIAQGVSDSERDRLLEDFDLSSELSDRLNALGDKLKAGEDVSWDDMKTTMDEVAVEHGIEGGLAMPHMVDGELKNRLVLAGSAPLRLTRAALGSEYAQELHRDGLRVRNTWERLGDRTVVVVDTEKGTTAFWLTHAGQRLRKILDDMGIRSGVLMTADAELKALASLKEKITAHQYNLYVISGSFLERSKRSDISYMFRKGRPTLAISCHGRDNDSSVIAALCFHPYGYYDGSHVGVLVPTDEVITALLMMRGDEHKFWGKSGQWHASDPRSGI